MAGDFAVLTFDGTNLIDQVNYFTIIPDADSAVQHKIGFVRGHHTHPYAGKPSYDVRILTPECFIWPVSNASPYADLDAKLDSLKKLLDTNDGPKKLVMQRPGQVARYLNCYCQQFAIDRKLRKATWQFVAPDPWWRENVAETDVETITATGQTWTITNVGSKFSRPKFTLSVTSANANTWKYHRRIVLKNPMTTTAIPAGYMYDITNGGLDTATLVAAGKMNTDGSDVRVELDGHEVPYWMVNFNSANTLIWIRFTEPLPKSNVDNSGGEWVRNNANLAPGTKTSLNTATTSATVFGNHTADHVLSTTFDSDGNPDEDITREHHQVTTTSTNIIVDMLAQTRINRVRVLHLEDNNAASNYTIDTSPDNITYTTQVTVTSNTVQGKFTTHDFTFDVTCRYVRVAITTSQGGSNVGINKVKIFNAHYRLQLKYGNPKSGPPHFHALVSQPHSGGDNPMLPGSSVAFKPMFDPNASSNNTHVYYNFADTTKEGKYRTGQWQHLNIYKDPLGRVYWGTQDTLSNPSNALGVSQVNAGVGHADTWQIYEACGVRAVGHSGNVKHKNSFYRWRQLSRTRREHTPVQDWEYSYANPTTWTGYSGLVVSYAYNDEEDTKYYILFNLHRYAPDPSKALHYGEATSVSVALATQNVPTSSIQGETAVSGGTGRVHFEAKIMNTTNGDAIHFKLSNFPTGSNVIIDCDKKQAYRDDNNHSILTDLVINNVRIDWMRLDPGANVMKWIEPGIATVSATTTWEARWV